MNAIRAAAPLLLLSLLPGCGESGHDEGEHHYESYSECFDGEMAEGGTETNVLVDCDEQFPPDHTDSATCLTFYSENGVPTGAATTHCEELYPAA